MKWGEGGGGGELFEGGGGGGGGLFEGGSRRDFNDISTVLKMYCRDPLT